MQVRNQIRLSWSCKLVQDHIHLHPNRWNLTLVLLNPDKHCFANSVDPDQLAASEEAN